MQYQYFFLIFLLFITPLTNAQEGEQPTADVLRVGYAGSAPFVMHNDQGEEEEEGIVIDIWKEIAFDINKKYQLIPYASVEEGIEDIQKQKLDILIGPITINANRAEVVTFSQPYYNTELAVLAPKMESTFWDKLKPFLSSTFLYAVAGLLVILTLVGFIFWLVEGRKEEDDYGKGVIKGTASGVWLAVVTMTTVGYGDYAPRTPAGRFVMGTWMIVSLILATSFVAGIATTFSQSSTEDKTITSFNDLENKKVAIPNYEKIIAKVKDAHGKPVPVTDVSEGYQLLLNKEVDALIYDEIPLEYILDFNKKDQFVLSKKRIEPQYYGFVFPIGSSLKRSVDLEIIDLQDNKKIKEIVDDWISKN